MPRQSRIYVEGIKELKKFFKKNEEAALKILKEATEEGIKPVEETAKQLCPVRTGKLKQSIERQPVKSKTKGRETWKLHIKGKRKGGVTYGFIVETGTKKTKPKKTSFKDT